MVDRSNLRDRSNVQEIDRMYNRVPDIYVSQRV